MIRTLKSLDELDASRVELGRRNLDFSRPARTFFYRLLFHARFRKPLQPTDITKSWDVDHALRIIESSCKDRDSPILDMGCYNSEVLYGLYALGFQKIYGCDLNPLCRWMPYWNKIHYVQADLTQTPFPDHYFGARSPASQSSNMVFPSTQWPRKSSVCFDQVASLSSRPTMTPRGNRTKSLPNFVSLVKVGKSSPPRP